MQPWQLKPRNQTQVWIIGEAKFAAKASTDRQTLTSLKWGSCLIINKLFCQMQSFLANASTNFVWWTLSVIAQPLITNKKCVHFLAVQVEKSYQNLLITTDCGSLLIYQLFAKIGWHLWPSCCCCTWRDSPQPRGQVAHKANCPATKAVVNKGQFN